MRSETRWTMANWISWSLAVIWCAAASVMASRQVSQIQSGALSGSEAVWAQLGIVAGPLGLALLCGILLLKRRYVELTESTLIDCRVGVTRTYRCETITRVVGWRAPNGRDALIAIECQDGNTMRRVKMTAAQEGWPTLVARLWKRLPLLDLDLAPTMTRRIAAIRDERPTPTTIGLAPMGPLKYDLGRTYLPQFLFAGPAFAIVSLSVGGAMGCLLSVCTVLPVMGVILLIDYLVVRQNVHVELRPDGFAFRDQKGVDYWIPWGELTAIGRAGGMGNAQTWIHAREKTIRLSGELKGMKQVHFALAEALQAIDNTLDPGTPPPSEEILPDQ